MFPYFVVQKWLAPSKLFQNGSTAVDIPFFFFRLCESFKMKESPVQTPTRPNCPKQNRQARTIEKTIKKTTSSPHTCILSHIPLPALLLQHAPYASP